MTTPKITGGGSAFPHPDEFGYVRPGMTLLDYFAGQVVSGMASSGRYDTKHLASIAYDVAEGMLAEREARFEAKKKAESAKPFWGKPATLD